MNAISFIGKKSGRKLFKFEATEEEYGCLREEDAGACILCGAETAGVEPDARKYECDGCGGPGVYGIEELLLMGYVNIVGMRNERISADVNAITISATRGAGSLS